jgi:hypothetical protein
MNQTIGKASKTLGFLRRNLGRCTTKTKATAYTTLVRPVLEYASPVWDPHQITTTRDIEQVQRRAARFAYNCYQDHSPGCVTNLLNSLQWEFLQKRRWKQSLIICYMIHHQLIAIKPADYYTAGDSRTRGNHMLRQIRAAYQHSFFPKSTREWNQVPVVDAGSLEDFKVRLNSIPCLHHNTDKRQGSHTMYILYMIFICIYHPSLWTFTCFGGVPCLIVYAPESHTLSNYRVRLVSGKKKKCRRPMIIESSDDSQ